MPITKCPTGIWRLPFKLDAKNSALIWPPNLAKAVKPVFLPGDTLELQVMRPGKESGQGVGFLDDGTMVVVDNARKKVGKRIHCVVTSLVQTASGRMVFARFESTSEQQAGSPTNGKSNSSEESGKTTQQDLEKEPT